MAGIVIENYTLLADIEVVVVISGNATLVGLGDVNQVDPLFCSRNNRSSASVGNNTNRTKCYDLVQVRDYQN